MTTSRDPSSKLISFAKEVALVVPGAKSQNRGTTVIPELVESCRASEVTDVIVVHETRRATPLVSFSRHENVKYLVLPP